MNPSLPIILIVDDEPGIIRGIREILKSEYTVRAALSGRDALAVCQSDPPPDLVLLDLGLPDMDGYAVLERLKMEPSTRKIPVIILTGREEHEDEANGIRKGAADYVTKNFHPAVLKARIGNHLELKKAREELENLIYRDGLTRIYNRRKFDESLEHEWFRAMRNGAPVAAILVDIDEFKKYNDHYHHTAGDECLVRVAQALAASIHRAGDFVARYGGEEFVAILPGTGVEGALMVAERMRENVWKLAIPHALATAADRVTISVGVASRVPERDEAPQALVDMADHALYRAKAFGRNRIVVNEGGALVTPPGRG